MMTPESVSGELAAALNSREPIEVELHSDGHSTSFVGPLVNVSVELGGVGPGGRVRRLRVVFDSSYPAHTPRLVPVPWHRRALSWLRDYWAPIGLAAVALTVVVGYFAMLLVGRA